MRVMIIIMIVRVIIIIIIIIIIDVAVRVGFVGVVEDAVLERVPAANPVRSESEK